MRLLALSIFTLFGLSALQAQTPVFVSDSLDSYIARYMAAYDIPGLAISIIKDGKVVVEKGYGVREVGKPDLVDAHTLFMIASNSKLFTGTAVAMLDSEKKLKLDDPVRSYLPDFRLYDTLSTQLVTVRDILSHRLGTITFQGDFTFWNSNLSRSEIVRRMRFMPPKNLFRQNYGYCNAGYIAAGEVIKATSGQTWEDFVTKRILQPVGMWETQALSAGLSISKNHARPYSNPNGTLVQLPYDRVDNFGPAASILSNVHDLGLWLQCQLDSGKVAGVQTIAWDALRKTRQGNTIQSTTKSSFLPRHFSVYGLGVGIGDYNGYQVYSHTGGAFGYVTGTCFVPEAKLGIAILTNNDNQSFFELLRYQILDAYLGVPYTDRAALDIQRHKAGLLDQKQLTDSLYSLASRSKTSDLPEATAFQGKFTHPLYGFVICEPNTDGSVLVRLPLHPTLQATLQPLNDHEALLSYNQEGYGLFVVPFNIKEGIVDQFTLRVTDNLETEPYVFVRE